MLDQPLKTSTLGNTLIVRPGALGDSVLTLPALHALRLSGAENLLVLGTLSSWGFARNSHDSLRVRDFSSSEWLGLFGEGVALGDCARAALSKIQTAIVYLNGDLAPTVRALNAQGVKNVLCVDPPRTSQTPPIAEAHAAMRLLDPLSTLVSAEHIAAALEIQDYSNDPFLKMDDNERSRGLYAIGCDAPPERGFAAIHPGSGGRSKCWPIERFAKLCVKLSCEDGLVPLVFFGPADEDLRDAFESSIPPGVEWQCAANRPLREVLALLSYSRIYIGNDSGMTHLAGRACPTIALFGPTNPAIWSPLGKNVKVLRAPDGNLERLGVEEVLSVTRV
jgi:hypothetical protein